MFASGQSQEASSDNKFDPRKRGMTNPQVAQSVDWLAPSWQPMEGLMTHTKTLSRRSVTSRAHTALLG
jgi:hypothetical protein